MNIKYAEWEGIGVALVSDPPEAWSYSEYGPKVWKLMNVADAMSKAKLVTESDFKSMFPDAPPFPPEAFKNQPAPAFEWPPEIEKFKKEAMAGYC